MTAREDAATRQRHASDPAASAWVVASAGSGKTRVLTDRILRLLLDGAAPQALLCITYTRAAAANMATRLHADLARWARLDDAALGQQIAERIGSAPDAALLARARTLLARALDAPGGMRIGTIHSLAQTLLRRFPLEARVAPHFALLEEADRADLLRDARERVLAAAHEDAVLHAALDRLARHFAPGKFGELVGKVIEAGALPHDRATLRRRFALPEDASAETLLAEAVDGGDAVALSAAAGALGRGAATYAERGNAMAAWLGADAAARRAGWQEWCGHFLTKEGEPRTAAGMVGKKIAGADPATLAAMQAEAERILVHRGRLAALQAAEITGALASLCAPVFAAFAEAKQSRAALDYGDLIAGAERLLGGEDAPWVLFRLDGGLDHLLIDEAQDTAPAQWAIAASLTEEFFAGEGARGALARSVFAVGDPKQSIFSFQGADPALFAAAGTHYARLAAAAGQAFRPVALPVSFRSTQAVLDLVNAVEPAWGQHIAARAGAGGAVELWPLIGGEQDNADGADDDDDDIPPPLSGDAPASAEQRCAEAIAEDIHRGLAERVLPARGRKMRPGDVLVLARRRRAFTWHLVRALKQRGVPVAGTDRLRLTDALAVQDCLAFLDCLLLPEDDLTLAAVLKGPFCALTETSLMELALGRKGRLIAALRSRAGERADWAAADRLLETFRGQADFLDAHALLAALLDQAVPGAPTGRAALLARLGEQAVEPIDELLQAALADSLRHAPSLQGFLHRLRTANAEIRRDADQQADAVRIMTVHGAKGLQAPVVYLADTTSLPSPLGPLVMLDGRPAWLPPSATRPTALADAAAAAHAAQLQEYQRLLYVALTRAEDFLVVTGWQMRGQPDPACWHARVAQAFDGLPGAATVDRPGIGLVRRHACAQTAAADAAPAPAGGTTPQHLPAWATPAPAEAPTVQRLKPSGEDDAAEAPPAPPPFGADDRAAARLRRGDLTHLLLQHLPCLAPPARAAAAESVLARHAADLDATLRAGIAAEALAVLDHPESAPLFDEQGLAEAPIVGELDGRPVNGVIDRLVVREDRVLLLDFKTDRAPPARPEEAPEKYRRQLAIYRALLRRLFPGRAIEAALVWTAGPSVMWLPAAVLDAALAPRAA